MTPRRISHIEAAEYWADPSQLEPGVTPDMLPEGAVYIAGRGICGAFRSGAYPGVWLADYGAKPDHWGHLTEPGKAVLEHFWDRFNPTLIVGLTDRKNRAAVAFARRLGFRAVGEFTPSVGERIVIQEWRPGWAAVC